MPPKQNRSALRCCAGEPLSSACNFSSRSLSLRIDLPVMKKFATKICPILFALTLVAIGESQDVDLRAQTETEQQHNAASRADDEHEPRKVASKRYSVRQVWPQEPEGLDRPYFVTMPRESAITNRKSPVVFLFHGNGGQARRMIGNWPQLLPRALLVAPQGYERSWNISDERSLAPDVAFFEAILDDLPKNHPEADMTNVSLIGFSNGAGFIYRLLIEVDGAGKIRAAVPLISSMTEEQFHDQAFWKRSDDSKRIYDRKVEPGRRTNILTIQGVEDRVVPYAGGLRGRTARHLSAQRTAWAWATHQGFRGEPIADEDGEPIERGVVRYDYRGSHVSHIKLEATGHGLGPHDGLVKRLVAKFVTNAKSIISAESTSE